MKPTVENFVVSLEGAPGPRRYWVAYSGGLDSHVLLHLCARSRALTDGFPPIRAIHVHHGLQAAADAWAEHCEQICRDLGVPFSLIAVNARPAPGESPEQVARHVRYEAIRRQMDTGEVVLTAQHADDQAETVLLQLLRGAGPAGLAAMPQRTSFPPGFLLRPLLQHTREELEAYASEHRLHWIEDPSNDDIRYDRNFIRRCVLPLLASRWPSANRSLARSAAHCAEALAQLDNLSTDLYHMALNADDGSLFIGRLSAFNPADQRLVLRHWLKAAGYRMPPAVALERIQRELLPAATDRMPRVAWREGEVRRYRDGLFVMPPCPAFDASATLAWDGVSALGLPDGNGALTVTPARPGYALNAQAWESGPIRVSYRQGGERCRLLGRAGSHSLKKLFQEAGIPPWLRERAPLIYIGGELAAIADWWVAEPFAAAHGARSLGLRWQRHAMQALTPAADPDDDD